MGKAKLLDAEIKHYVFDYLGTFNLNLARAETVTSHLPVFGEFSATEGTTY